VELAKGVDGWRRKLCWVNRQFGKLGSDLMESSGWKRVMEQEKIQKRL